MGLADIQRLLDLTRRNVENGETWTLSVGKYAQLHYVKSDTLTDEVAKQYAATFDGCIEEDCKALQFDLPKEPFPIYLYPDGESLAHALNWSQKLSGGMSLGSWAVIIMPPKGSSEDLAASGAHEIGHGLVHENLGALGCPLFAEAIAFYLQGRYRNSAWIKQPTPILKTPLKELLASAKNMTQFLEGARFFSYLVITDHGDPTRLKELIHALHLARFDDIVQVGKGTWDQRVDRTFVKIYGKSLDELEQAWRSTTFPN